MIRINLAHSKGQVDLANVGGLDLSKIKIKAVIIAIILLYVPDMTFIPMWQTEREELQAQINQKNAVYSDLRKKVDEGKTYEQQIKELQAQEENLGQKLVAVKEAISEKKNPAALLLYIARNTPDDLWFTELTMKDNELIIKGEALNYPSVGEFVSNISASVFIGSSNIIRTASKVRDDDKKRVEEFEIKFIISRFEQ
ncbi:MAG TPA: PilN domain-containing protein [Bacteriovoracaceae bacterium]|nr:PilN domain-containing protein [Bacteriovoracaceae bacterium]